MGQAVHNMYAVENSIIKSVYLAIVHAISTTPLGHFIQEIQ
jgi:hypothetical protein